MKRAYLLMLMFSVMLSAAHAGQGTGNGGYSYVCRDANGDITSARLLDLWEPETYTTHRDYTTPMEAQIEAALTKVKDITPKGVEILKAQLEIEKNRLHFTRRNLPITQDALPRYAPERDCNYEQVARHGFNPERGAIVLEINSTIFNHAAFSNSDKAALYIHEALYTLARKNLSVERSDSVRLVVAKLFSDTEFRLNDKKSLLQMLVGESEALQILISELDIGTDVSGGIFQTLGDVETAFRDVSVAASIESPEKRTEVIVNLLHERAVKTRKLWLIFSKSYVRKYNFDWMYYVVPMIYLKEEKLVLDTKYSRGPREIKKWTDIFMRGDEACKVIEKYREVYTDTSESSCYLLETSSDMKTINDVMMDDWRNL